MKEDIKKILDDYSGDLEHFKEEQDRRVEQLRFYKKHNLKEEERITRVQYDCVSLIIQRWKDMVNDLKEVLNKHNQEGE